MEVRWGERAPATAGKTVQVYVSHLRKALGAGVIVTDRSGYRLATQPERVDVGQFELLSAEGRRALAEGDPTRARERLCSALACGAGSRSPTSRTSRSRSTWFAVCRRRGWRRWRIGSRR